MQKSGIYNCRLQWLKGYRTVDEQGQQVLTAQENGYLWASVEETNGRNTADYGAKQPGADVTILVKDAPPVSTDDLLRDESGTVYRIESIYGANNELSLQAYRNDKLTTDVSIAAHIVGISRMRQHLTIGAPLGSSDDYSATLLLVL
ncbi:head-tail adaptor protein [Gemmata sp. G18]|uniref:Head-tail adaptor protein n=1 Tax=Gemmata palustris TaxID=2822762 RepID=A0ABS5BMG8_9BACT|nr:head-tail adaptor protein [Gemmata palustris]MBP3954918.1 head-tail adaptor protein [Gemmata palustris]